MSRAILRLHLTSANLRILTTAVERQRPVFCKNTTQFPLKVHILPEVWSVCLDAIISES